MAEGAALSTAGPCPAWDWVAGRGGGRRQRSNCSSHRVKQSNGSKSLAQQQETPLG